jgi:hypothetical protein
MMIRAVVYSQRLQSAVHECYELSEQRNKAIGRDEILCIEKPLPIMPAITSTFFSLAFVLFLSLLVVVRGVCSVPDDSA